MDSKTKLDKIVHFLDDKKARDIQIVNTEKISLLADYFVICSGTSTTHIRALTDELRDKMKESGMETFHVEGYDTARWILVDYGDVIIHVFHEEDRRFYNLERLWSEGIVSVGNRI